MKLALGVSAAAFLAALALVAVSARATPSPAADRRAASSASSASSPVPVVVELFTSEGCSSCPPADRVLGDLAAAGAVAGAVVLPIAWHVDYWDDLGWKDPFSAAAHTERQRAYAAARGSRRVYTPQAVVAGGEELLGSDGKSVRAAVVRAARAGGRVALGVSATRAPAATSDGAAPAGIIVTVDVGALVAAAELVVVLTEDGLVTDVRRGENRGARLGHTGVARRFVRLALPAAAVSTRREVTLAVDPSWARAHTHVVAFVQTPGPGAILGAATIDLPSR